MKIEFYEGTRCDCFLVHGSLLAMMFFYDEKV